MLQLRKEVLQFSCLGHWSLRRLSLSLSLQINDYNDKPDMIRKLKRQPWPWPLSISVTYTCGIRSRAANGLKDPLMEKKRNLIELGISIQFAWESDNISKHHKTKHCDWMSWDVMGCHWDETTWQSKHTSPIVAPAAIAFSRFRV